MRFAKFYVIVFAVVITSCQTARKHQLVSSYNEQEFLKLLEPTGKNTIKGSAFMRKANGEVVTCAGTKIVLFPNVPYSAERIQVIYGNTDQGYNSVNARPVEFMPLNPSYLKSGRETVCNVQGQFVFENVKDGEYFIHSQISWMYAYVSYTPQYTGGSIFKKVAVSKGATVDVVLSPN